MTTYTAELRNESGAWTQVDWTTENKAELKRYIRSAYGGRWKVTIFKHEDEMPPEQIEEFALRG